MSDRSRRLEPLSARETVALPEPAENDLLLGPYVRRGCRTIISGGSGNGKTTLGLAMAAAILLERELFGVHGAGAGPVLLVDLEQGLRSVKRMLREAGLADRDDVHVVRAPDGLALDADDGVDIAELGRVIAEIRPAVVVIDPLYKAHRADANEERGVTDLMRQLDALRERYGFALILPAHVRKEQTGNGVRKLTLDDVAGSGAITRGAEVVVAIERVVHGLARLRVLKDRDGDLAVGEALDLTYTRETGFVVRQAEDLVGKAHDVGSDGEYRTLREWASALGCRERTAGGVLERLLEAGCFELAVGPPGRSRNARCWKLRTAPAEWAESGGAAELEGQARHCAHCARVYIGTRGLGVVTGAPSGSAPGAHPSGAVDEEDEARWRSLLAEKARLCAVGDCRREAAPGSDLCRQHETLRTQALVRADGREEAR